MCTFSQCEIFINNVKICECQKVVCMIDCMSLLFLNISLFLQDNYNSEAPFWLNGRNVSFIRELQMDFVYLFCTVIQTYSINVLSEIYIVLTLFEHELGTA
jgi:hypothetical protein